jgi:predicted nucleic acid-binding protein
LAELKRDDSVHIVPPTLDLYDAGLDLYARRMDKDWSLTDCISFEAMRRHQISDALTTDHHFEQAGFNVLLK